MTQIEDYLYKILGTFLFILALSIYIPLNNTISDYLFIIREEIMDRKEIYVQSLDRGYTNHAMTYAQLIGMLLSDRLEYDLQIDGVVFLKKDFDFSKVDFAKIPKSTFSKTYQYEKDGSIVKIILVHNGGGS